MTSSDSPSIVRVDPRHRGWVAAGLVVIALIGALAVMVLPGALEGWASAYQADLATRSADALRRDFTVLSLVASAATAAPLVLVGGMLLYQGARIRAAGRYPYPGMMILRDTALETGAPAEARARRLLVVGGVIVVTAAIAGGYLHSTMMGLLPTP